MTAAKITPTNPSTVPATQVETDSPGKGVERKTASVGTKHRKTSSINVKH